MSLALHERHRGAVELSELVRCSTTGRATAENDDVRCAAHALPGACWFVMQARLSLISFATRITPGT
jgi:hypothetical protein